MKHYRRKIIKKIIGGLGLFILVLILVNWDLLFSIGNIYYRMGQINAREQDQVGSHLTDLKQIALHLLRLSERERRLTIAAYNLYARDHYPAAFNQFLLMRMVFDVPEAYPLENARLYFIFFGDGIGDEKNLNLLWPLGYDGNGDLILKHKVWGYHCFGLCPHIYESIPEYDFFKDRFPLRSRGLGN
jgi:hypothetical protein